MRAWWFLLSDLVVAFSFPSLWGKFLVGFLEVGCLSVKTLFCMRFMYGDGVLYYFLLFAVK